MYNLRNLLKNFVYKVPYLFDGLEKIINARVPILPKISLPICFIMELGVGNEIIVRSSGVVVNSSHIAERYGPARLALRRSN